MSNPRNLANLVIVDKIDSPRFSCALHVSFDGGVHWNQTPIPLPAGEEPKCYAPDAVFSADGVLHMSFVTLRGRATRRTPCGWSAPPDGGQTLSDPVRARGKLKFQVRLAADPAAPRRLYMTWLEARDIGLFKFAQPGNPLRAARSDDGGRTWSAPVTLNPPSRGRAIAPTPAVGARGELYVLYLDLGDDVLDYGGGHAGRGGAPYAGNWSLVLARSPIAARRGRSRSSTTRSCRASGSSPSRRRIRRWRSIADRARCMRASTTRAAATRTSTCGSSRARAAMGPGTARQRHAPLRRELAAAAEAVGRA